MMLRKYSSVALLVVLLAVSSALAEGVQVNRAKSEIQRHTFDPKNPPPHMPPLEKNEAAVTKSQFGIESAVSLEVIDQEERGGKTVARVKLDGVSANLSLKIDIWNPTDAPRAIVEHEEGHRRISEHFYEDAEKIAQRLAKQYIGKVYTAEGTDADDASRKALDKALNELAQRYMAETQIPSARANEIFDEITNHGRNQRITVDKAMKQAIERAKRK